MSATQAISASASMFAGTSAKNRHLRFPAAPQALAQSIAFRVVTGLPVDLAACAASNSGEIAGPRRAGATTADAASGE